MKESIDSYWETYDKLVKSIDESGVKAELEDAKLYVNGLTDGWYGFLNDFGRIISRNKSRLTSEQIRLIDKLIEDLKYHLENR